MFFIRHYSVVCSNGLEMKEIIEEKYGVPCDLFSRQNSCNVIFDFPETNPQLGELERFLHPGMSLEGLLNDETGYFQNNTDDSPKVFLLSCYPVYSEEERLAAKWLTVRSVFSKVTAPNLLNLIEATQDECFVRETSTMMIGRHRIQTEPYILRSPIKWGKNFFCSGGCSEYTLFCNKIARKMLEKERLKGLEFHPVIQKKDGQHMEDVFQLSAGYTTPDTAIVPISDAKKYVCPTCGMNLLQRLNTRALYGIAENSLDETVDVHITPPLFVGPKEPVAAWNQLIVSQRFYRTIKEIGLDRSLVFTPLGIQPSPVFCPALSD